MSGPKQTSLWYEDESVLYRTLIESINDGVGLADERGVIQFSNDRLSKILGFHKSELIGKHWTSFFDKRTQEVIEEQ